MVGISLCFDILDVVLDTLIAEASEKYDPVVNAALRAFSLVHRACTHRAQEQLFATIILYSGRKLYPKFSTLITKSPHIGTYVKRFYIRYDSYTDDKMAAFDSNIKYPVAHIINSLNNLHFLHLCALDFAKIPDDVRNALLARLQTIGSLELHATSNFPMQYILSCSGLNELCVFDRKDYLPVNELGIAKSLASLEKLHTNNETWLRFLTRAYTFPLQSLEVENMSFLSIPPFLERVQSTLLCLSVRWVYKVPQHSFSVEFPLLEKIEWRVSVGGLNDSLPSDVLYLSSILESGDISPRRLKSMILLLSDHNGSAPSIASHHIWHQIDTTLSHPRYTEFDLLTLLVSKPSWAARRRHLPSEEYRKGLEEDFLQSFPILHRCRKIRVEVEVRELYG